MGGNQASKWVSGTDTSNSWWTENKTSKSDQCLIMSFQYPPHTTLLDGLSFLLSHFTTRCICQCHDTLCNILSGVTAVACISSVRDAINFTWCDKSFVTCFVVNLLMCLPVWYHITFVIIIYLCYPEWCFITMVVFRIQQHWFWKEMLYPIIFTEIILAKINDVEH